MRGFSIEECQGEGCGRAPEPGLRRVVAVGVAQLHPQSLFSQGHGLEKVEHTAAFLCGGQAKEAFRPVGVGSKESGVARVQNAGQILGFVAELFRLVLVFPELLKELVGLLLPQRLRRRAPPGKALRCCVGQPLPQRGVLVVQTFQVAGECAESFAQLRTARFGQFAKPVPVARNRAEPFLNQPVCVVGLDGVQAAFGAAAGMSELTGPACGFSLCS